MKRSTITLPDHYKIGSKVRELRHIKGMKQATLAKALNISRAALSNIEKDSCEVTLQKCFAIAQVFGIEITDLFTHPSPIHTYNSDAF